MGLFSSSKSSSKRTTNNVSTVTDNRVQGGEAITAGQGASVVVQSDRALALAENAVSQVLNAEQARNTGELELLGRTALEKTIPFVAGAFIVYQIFKGSR